MHFNLFQLIFMWHKSVRSQNEQQRKIVENFMQIEMDLKWV